MTETEFLERFSYNPSSDLLGSGGFADVYKVFDKKSNAFVALKIYKEKFSNKYDLLSEKKRTEGIDHQNLCKYFDVFELKVKDSLNHETMRQYAVVEYMNAGTLSDYIKTHNPDLETKKKLFIDILHGLECLHSNGIIHRDIKPENILVNISDEGLPIAKITDFGISKKVDDIGKRSSQLFGASCYMAPEQFDPIKFGLNGEINTNVDLWAFGMVVYESITGNRLIQSTTDNIDIALKDIEAFDLKLIENLEQPYQFLVKNCLIKDARDRVKSADELIQIFTVIPTINFKNSYTSKFDNQFKSERKRNVNPLAIASLFLCLLLFSTGIIFRNEISDFFNHDKIYAQDSDYFFEKGYSLYQAQQYDSSFYYFSKADAMGSPKGQFMLGEHYLMGKGVKIDLDSAKYFYKKAASNDFADAFVRLGDIAYKNNQLPEALENYKQASEKGYNGNIDDLEKKKQEIAHQLSNQQNPQKLTKEGNQKDQEIPTKRDCPDCNEGLIYAEVQKTSKCNRACKLGKISTPCSKEGCENGKISGERSCSDTDCDKGKKRKDCYRCTAGYKKVNCYDCKGKGEISRCEKCNSCQGYRGYFNYGIWYNCQNCKGNGQVKVTRTCNASGCIRGRIEESCPNSRCIDGYVYETCSTCDGSGTEEYTRKCNSCKNGENESDCPGKCNRGEVTTIEQVQSECKKCKGSGKL
jgi:serine/threonine protein kinase